MRNPNRVGDRNERHEVGVTKDGSFIVGCTTRETDDKH